MTVHVETTNAGAYECRTRAELEVVIGRMSKDNPHLVVRRDDRPGFLQANVHDPTGGGQVLVEHREDERSPLHRSRVRADEVADLLIGWAFDREGWQQGIEWEMEQMERVIDFRSACSFDASDGWVSCRLAHGAVSEELGSFWELVGHGESEAAAYADWLTEMSVLVNTSPEPVRVGWGRFSGTLVVERPMGTYATPLSDEQRERITRSSPFSWPEDGATG